MRLDAVTGYNNTINTTQVTQATQAAQAQPVQEVQPVSADGIEIQDLHQGVAQVDAAQKGEDGQEERRQTEAEIEAENERIRKAVSNLNKKLDQNTEAVFGVHEKTHRVTIKMVDKDSKKVIKEFPPDKTLDMIAKVWELAGIMVDEKG